MRPAQRQQKAGQRSHRPLLLESDVLHQAHSEPYGCAALLPAHNYRRKFNGLAYLFDP